MKTKRRWGKTGGILGFRLIHSYVPGEVTPEQAHAIGVEFASRLLREGKELKVFRIKESDLPEFRAFAKKNVLFAAVKDTRQTDGMIDLVTNVDFASWVNLNGQ